MAKNKENTAAEVLEQPIETTKEKSSSAGFDAETFFDKYKIILSSVLGVIVLAVAGYAGYKYYAGSQDKEAQSEMFIAVNYFEQDSLDLALKGNKINRGLVEIADEYGMTKGGNLANYYVGVIYLKQGKYEDAIEYLKKFDSGDLLVQARAYSLIGDAYSELKNNDDAITYYEKAANYNPNEYFTPRYLLKLAFAYESVKNYESAAKAYGTIVDKYSKSQEYNDARKYKARAEAMMAQ
jgi:tetratricopeptide (TPR) repeat protein